MSGVTLIHTTDNHHRHHHHNLYNNKDSVCKVECIILHDEREVEEDVLFISVGRTSTSTQTDAADTSYSSDGLPIIYCCHPSPGVATTQCLIPHRTDACVGTDDATTGTRHSPLTSPSAMSPPSTRYLKSQTAIKNGETKLKTPLMKNLRNATSNRPKTATTATTATTTATTATGPKKRGRKRNINHDKDENKITSILSTKRKRGRRKMTKKIDSDFEYELNDSDGVDTKLKEEYDDDDDDGGDGDWRSVKVRESDDDDDDDYGDGGGSSQIIPVSEFKSEVNIDDYDDFESDEGCGMIKQEVMNDDNDDDFDMMNMCGDGGGGSSGGGGGGIRNKVVMKVSVSGIGGDGGGGSSGTTPGEWKKYYKKAREKYHREKVVKEDGEVTYKCLKCEEEFKMRCDLVKHRKVHAGKVKMYECNHCDRLFSNAQKYYSHLGYHKRIFECQVCERQFSLLGNLRKHLTFHEGAAEQVCEVCGRQFHTSEELQDHRQAQHSDDALRRKLECKDCGRKYIREEYYTQHVLGGPYKCDVCEVMVGCETKLKIHVRNEHDVCVCEFCGKSFKQNSLLNHIRIMHGESQVSCPHCPKKFTFRSRMLAHVDANHNATKKYKCAKCTYTARTINTLNLHHRRQHQDAADTRKYACELCPRKFYLPSKLALHYRVHTGEKPFKCPSCTKTFTTNFNRTEHERSVHGERMLVTHPDGTYSVKVVKHRRTQRSGVSMSCEVCGVDLPSSFALVEHMKDTHDAQTLPPEEDTAVESILNHLGEGGVSGEYEANEKGNAETGEYEGGNEEVEGNYEAGNEQYEGEYEVGNEGYEDSGVGGEYEVTNQESDHQETMLTPQGDVLNIPEYATRVHINGVEYQVVRQ